MNNKNSITNCNKLFCILLLAVCLLFLFSCDEVSEFVIEGDRELNLSSENSGTPGGLYQQPFYLILTAKGNNSIYYSIDGSIPLPSKASGSETIKKYDSPIAVKNRNGQPNILASKQNTEQFYPHPQDPERFDPTHEDWLPNPYYPTAYQVPKATVIRAIEADEDGNHGAVMTRTYFIGDNLNKYGKHPILSIVTDPSNLLDFNTGIYVRGPGKSRYEYNYAKKGRAWEREANLEFFDGDKRLVFSTGVGIRIRGGWSRENGQKAFNVYFREEYGINNLQNYELIPGAVLSDGKTPLTRYKNFMLRNGGNDAPLIKFRDLYIQRLLADRSFTIEAGVPCIVYLNGEYWGPYNLREKYSDNWLEYKFGVNRNNVMSFEHWEQAEGVESDWDYYWSMMEHRYRDMSIQANYEAFCDIFDIQSFIDYFAAQIYVGNEDWPQNNNQLWRVRNPEPGNPYGDTKWRWMLHDLDMSMGIYRDGEVIDNIQRIKDEMSNRSEHRYNELLVQLMKNPDFCRQFVITMMDLYNVNFDYNVTINKLNEMANIFRPLMADYDERFGKAWNGWFDFDRNGVEVVRKYLQDVRPKMTTVFLPKHFGHLGIAANKLADVVLTVQAGGTQAPGASITINTTTPQFSSGSWTGKYYSVLPVTVTANVPDGYTFTGWTVTGGVANDPAALTSIVTFSGNVTIMANFSQE